MAFYAIASSLRNKTMKHNSDPKSVLAGIAKGKSHQSVARELGVSRQLIQALLSGKRQFSSRMLAKLGIERVEMYRRSAS